MVHHVQWNPVNTVTNGPKKFACINGFLYNFNDGFLKENVKPFCQVGKKSGHNNEVTILLNKVAVRRGFTVQIIYYSHELRVDLPIWSLDINFYQLNERFNHVQCSNYSWASSDDRLSLQLSELMFFRWWNTSYNYVPLRTACPLWPKYRSSNTEGSSSNLT